MTETYAESETEASRGNKKPQELRINTDSSQDAGRPSEGIGSQRLASDRKNRTEGIGAYGAIGGILNQLIEDARKQLAKSRECVVWYQEEVKESEEKLKNLLHLMELQELQQQEQEGDSENERLG